MLVIVIAAELHGCVIICRADPRLAERSKVNRDLQLLSTALREYREDTGRFPNEREGLRVLETREAGEQKWRGPYVLPELPKDPWGRSYVYRMQSEVGTFGADGKPGGDDRDKDEFIAFTIQ